MQREQKQEDELWKGIDQSLYLGPSNNIVWANVLIGRIIYGCLHDPVIIKFLSEFLEKKLTAIKVKTNNFYNFYIICIIIICQLYIMQLPSFMEDVHVAEIFLGDTPPIIHRISQPLLDERGVWIDADITYEGLMHMTISTKMNLMRLKKQDNQVGGKLVLGICKSFFFFCFIFYIINYYLII